MRGRAAVFHFPGQPFELTEFDVPDPEDGAAIIRIAATGICGSELHVWRGGFPRGIYERSPEGHALGHEMTGYLAKAGRDLTTDSLGAPLKEGDRVCFAYFYPCGQCYQCKQGELAACPHKLHWPKLRAARPWNGGFGEYYYLRPNHYIYKVPASLSTEVVATVNCALAQVMHAFRDLKLTQRDTVVIQGAGALGIYAVAVAKQRGAGHVVAIDRYQSRLDLAKAFGSDSVIDASQQASPADRTASIIALTKGQGADVVVDLAGVPEAIPEGLGMLRSGGKYLEIGCITPQQVAIDPSQLVFGSISIQGVYQYDPRILPEALDFLVKNWEVYPFNRLISHQLPLENIDEAFQIAHWQPHADNFGTVMRVLILP